MANFSVGISIEDLLRIATVIVSVCVVAAPILYPKYSLFVRRAMSGVEKLMQVREVENEVRLCYLEEGEKGFREVVKSAELMFGIDGQPRRICLAIGGPRDLGDYTGFGMEYGIGDNGVLYAEMKNGNKELLRWNGWSPSSTLNLEKLQDGIQLKSQDRSHYITMILAVLWATLSVVLVI